MGDDYCQKVVGSNPGAVYFNTFFANKISERLNFARSLRNFDWYGSFGQSWQLQHCVGTVFPQSSETSSLHCTCKQHGGGGIYSACQFKAHTIELRSQWVPMGCAITHQKEKQLIKLLTDLKVIVFKPSNNFNLEIVWPGQWFGQISSLWLILKVFGIFEDLFSNGQYFELTLANFHFSRWPNIEHTF